MSNRQPTEETFLKDVEKHKMTALLDNGVYRHLRLSSGSFNQQFDIVTYPWHLVFSGDMGCFVFSRLDDMFNFFRCDWINDRKDGKLRINPSYWGEKLEAVDRCGRESDFRVFDPEKMKEHVEDHIKNWIEECPVEFESDEKEEQETKKEFERQLRNAVDDCIYTYLDNGEHEARKALNEFSFTPELSRFVDTSRGYKFSDTWEWDLTDYTYRFIWCCYAVAWSIQQFDAPIVCPECSSVRERTPYFPNGTPCPCKGE